MKYQFTTGRALEHSAPQSLGAVRSAVRERNDAPALAMVFDPGEVTDIALHAHAVDIVMGLLYVRGWRGATQAVRVDNAGDWADRWWDAPLGPGAFVVETELQPDTRRCELDDIATIMSLAELAWCVELDACRSERPTPDVMMAVVCDGVSLASVRHALWVDALGGSLGCVAPGMGGRAQGVGDRSHAWVRMHLEGSPVEPWSLPGRSCVFAATAMAEPECRRTFIALRDTADAPSPETTRNLLHLMLATNRD